MNAAARKALQDAALFDVVAGEYGGGNSIDRARTIGNLQANETLATIAANARNAQSETGFRRLATLDQTQAKLAAINRPSVLGTALKIGGAAAGAYAQWDATSEYGSDRRLFEMQRDAPARVARSNARWAEWSKK